MSSYIILYLGGFFSSFFYYNIIKHDMIITHEKNIDIFLFFYIFTIYFILRFFLFLFHSFQMIK